MRSGTSTSCLCFHNPEPSFGGPNVGAPPVVATLGIDNIGAIVETTEVRRSLSSMLLRLAGLAADARTNLQSEAARAEADAVVTRFRDSACYV